jgi:hypothetical protein
MIYVKDNEKIKNLDFWGFSLNCPLRINKRIRNAIKGGEMYV